MAITRTMRIIPRRDTYENFTEANLVYRAGEMLIVHKGSVNRYKIGDGVHHFLELPYVSCENMITNGRIYSNNCIVTIEI